MPAWPKQKYITQGSIDCLGNTLLSEVYKKKNHSLFPFMQWGVLLSIGEQIVLLLKMRPLGRNGWWHNITIWGQKYAFVLVFFIDKCE